MSPAGDDDCQGPSCNPKTDCTDDDECQDSSFCNGTETCDPKDPEADSRGCVKGKRPSCDDGVACTEDECDEAKDSCRHVGPDADGDGHRDATCILEDGSESGDDCDDADEDNYPGNIEVCDDHDEDCNSKTVGYLDADGDGATSDQCCNGRTCGGDCDDSDLAVRPLQPEFCDDKDNDCDNKVDNDTQEVKWFLDKDGDLFGASDSDFVLSCEIQPDRSVVATDCNDSDPLQSRTSEEVCEDGVDNNCNGFIDEGADCKDPEGTPLCEKGETACGLDCEDLENDSANCGECDYACPSGKACEGGKCLAPQMGSGGGSGSGGASSGGAPGVGGRDAVGGMGTGGGEEPSGGTSSGGRASGGGSSGGGPNTGCEPLVEQPDGTLVGTATITAASPVASNGEEMAHYVTFCPTFELYDTVLIATSAGPGASPILDTVLELLDPRGGRKARNDDISLDTNLYSALGHTVDSFSFSGGMTSGQFAVRVYGYDETTLGSVKVTVDVRGLCEVDTSRAEGFAQDGYRSAGGWHGELWVDAAEDGATKNTKGSQLCVDELTEDHACLGAAIGSGSDDWVSIGWNVNQDPDTGVIGSAIPDPTSDGLNVRIETQLTICNCVLGEYTHRITLHGATEGVTWCADVSHQTSQFIPWADFRRDCDGNSSSLAYGREPLVSVSVAPLKQSGAATKFCVTALDPRVTESVFSGAGRRIALTSRSLNGLFFPLEDSVGIGSVLLSDGLTHTDLDSDTGDSKDVEPSNFDETTVKPCLSGVLAQVMTNAGSACTGSSCAYDLFWGGGIALSPSIDSEDQPLPWNAVAAGVTGLEFTLSGNVHGASLRLMAHQYDLLYSDDFCKAIPLNPGQPTRVDLTELRHHCWGDDGNRTLDLTYIGSLNWHIITDNSSPHVIENFCLESLAVY